jgi:hypothetical protein
MTDLERSPAMAVPTMGRLVELAVKTGNAGGDRQDGVGFRLPVAVEHVVLGRCQPVAIAAVASAVSTKETLSRAR